MSHSYLSFALVAFVTSTALHAGAQTREAVDQDSLFRARGWELFSTYQAGRGTEAGTEAGWQAFLMWANAGAADDVDRALESVPLSDEIWESIPRYISSAYLRTKARTHDDLEELLRGLEKKVRAPRQRTAVLYSLAELQQSLARHDQALDIFKQIISLDAHPFYVGVARAAVRTAELLQPGQEAPSFTVESINGDTLALPALRGRYVLLEFWGTWCAPCIPEIPVLRQIWAEYGAGDLTIIGVALDDDADALAGFLKEHEVTWPQVMEPMDRSGEISKSYGVNGVPASYLISPDGTLVAANLRGDGLLAMVRELLEP